VFKPGQTLANVFVSHVPTASSDEKVGRVLLVADLSVAMAAHTGGSASSSSSSSSSASKVRFYDSAIKKKSDLTPGKIVQVKVGGTFAFLLFPSPPSPPHFSAPTADVHSTNMMIPYVNPFYELWGMFVRGAALWARSEHMTDRGFSSNGVVLATGRGDIRTSLRSADVRSF
jgi:hypothetical protein